MATHAFTQRVGELAWSLAYAARRGVPALQIIGAWTAVGAASTEEDLDDVRELIKWHLCVHRMETRDETTETTVAGAAMRQQSGNSSSPAPAPASSA